MTQSQLPIRKTSGNNTIIEGTKTLEGRGWYYEYVEINNHTLAITVGREEGNYAGGNWLRPSDKGYEQRLEHFLTHTKQKDPNFYDLIIKELQMRGNKN